MAGIGEAEELIRQGNCEGIVEDMIVKMTIRKQDGKKFKVLMSGSDVRLDKDIGFGDHVKLKLLDKYSARWTLIKDRKTKLKKRKK